MMPVRTAKDMGALIRDRRRRLGMNQRTLAGRIGVSRQWVVEAEQGKPGAGIALMLRALQAVGVTLGVDEGPPRAARRWTGPVVDIDAIVRRARKAPR